MPQIRRRDLRRRARVCSLRLLEPADRWWARGALRDLGYGRRLLFDEAGIRSASFECLCPRLAPTTHGPDGRPHADRLICHPNRDVGAVIASGSFLHSGMVVVPCSSTSLGAIATGAGSNLLTRAAMVTLKERRTLILCHRETPLSLIDIENMRTLAFAGAVVCPTNPGFYLGPRDIGDIVDFMAGKVLDLLHVTHTPGRVGGAGSSRATRARRARRVVGRELTTRHDPPSQARRRPVIARRRRANQAYRRSHTLRSTGQRVGAHNHPRPTALYARRSTSMPVTIEPSGRMPWMVPIRRSMGTPTLAASNPGPVISIWASLPLPRSRRASRADSWRQRGQSPSIRMVN